jgi:hypothetical protein
MKKILMTLAALLSLNVHAEWVSYQRGADADELYDNKIISRDASTIKLWTLTSFAKPMTTLEGKDYQSEKMLTTVDCALRKIGAEQVVRMTSRNGQGETVSMMESPLRLMSVRSGSADERLLEKLCR